jgi:hypothetical protein
MCQRPPDAVRSSLLYAGPGSSFARLARLQTEFSVLLGTPQVFVRLQGMEHFITCSPNDTLLYPTDSKRPGEPRYDWEDRGDGVVLGYLRADEEAR